MREMKFNKWLLLLILFILLVAVLFFGNKHIGLKIKKEKAIAINIEEINYERTNKNRLADEKIRWINQYLENDEIDKSKKEITEAEFLVLLSKEYGISPSVTDTSEFWAAGYYKKVIKEYGYESIDVNQSNYDINQVRAAEIISLILGEKVKGKESINFLMDNGFQDLFDPAMMKRKLSREEGIEIINRTLKKGFYTFQETNLNNNQTFVFLGDSISLGWNANNTLTQGPTKYGFPYLVGNQFENYYISNLSSRGAVTTTILTELQNPLYQEKISKSDLICIDIGSVDLLGAAREFLERLQNGNGGLPTVNEVNAIQDAAKNAMSNLDSIIEEVRKYSDSPIYIVGLYSPIPSGTIGDEFGDSIIKKINKHSAKIAINDPSIIYIDTFLKFNGRESSYVINGEIHPTYEGQKVLASLLLEKLPKQ